MTRIRREEGIKVSKKQRRMKRLGISTAQRQQAERPCQVWSWDFLADQTENGSSFRILTLLDEHTRQCLAIHPAWSILAIDVITVVEAAIARDGMPEHLRCLQDWLKAQEIKTLYIKPRTYRELSRAMNPLTENSPAICVRRALSWKAGVSNTMSVVRTARLAIRANTRVDGRTGLMGVTRPQTPRRSPRQAFGGNSGATPQGGKQTKTKTLRNPQNFSYEVSHLWGHANFLSVITRKITLTKGGILL